MTPISQAVSTPRVSVLIPAFDREDMLRETLESVLAQTYPNWEAVVVDDGSTDRTYEVATEFRRRDPDRVKVVRAERNGGCAAARNLAVAASTRSELMCLLDSDDYWAENYLEHSIAIYDEARAAGRRVGIVSSNALVLTPEGLSGETWFGRNGWIEKVTYDAMLELNYLSARAIFSREAFEQAGGTFCTECLGSDDYDLWLRIMEAGYEAIMVPEPYAVYRDHPGADSRNHLSRAEGKVACFRRALARGRISPARRRAARRRIRHFKALRERELVQRAIADRRMRDALVHGAWAAVRGPIAFVQYPSRWLEWMTDLARPVLRLVRSDTTDARVRVLHVGPEPSPLGGMGLSIQRLLASPLAERYRMEALATWRYGVGRAGRLRVFACALARMAVWCLLPGRRVVHVHASVRGSWYRKGVCILLARALGRPVVLQVRVGVADMADFHARLGPVRRALFRRMFALPDRVLSVSVAGANEVAARWARSDVEVVTNPAPAVATGPPGGPRSPGEGSEVLYIGGFRDPAKGYDVLLEALDAIIASDGAVRVTLAGPGDPPADWASVLRDEPAVEWIGWLDAEAKSAAFSRADVFVLPSRSEGMPNAMLEAMAHGCAIVATGVGGVPDVLEHEVEGLIVPPGDPDPLSDAVIGLLRDPARRSALGWAARERTERLSRDEVYGRLDRIYGELTSARRRFSA